MRFTARKGRFTKANASRLGKLGAASRAKKRMESDPPCYMDRVPKDMHLGTLQWHASDGTVRRWTIKQGPRANNIKVQSKGKTIVCGWDFMMRKLRKHLSVPKKLIS